MGRLRVFAIFALLLSAVVSQASVDYRLVIASDDPGVRKAATMVVFEGTGKLTKEDRITSITFSAAADLKPNCVVSLDPASGKSPLSLGPDVEVFGGNLMIAGTKPTKKVIPAYLAVDVPVTIGDKEGKLGSVMQPIIKQVNNIPWLYIVIGVGIFLGITALMNRRSLQFTTSMSKEAKNLYLETVGRITERLEKIETTQERLVKNPPVVRTFKAQIEDFEGRLGRIEKLAKEAKDEIGKASAELSQTDKRHTDLVGRIDATKAETGKTQSTLKQEADGLRAELKLLLKGQDEATAKLGALDDLKASDKQISEQGKHLESMLSAQEAAILKAQAEHLQQLQQLQGELATMRANQEALSALPKELELVSANIANMPTEFESVRSAMPRLDGIEARLDGISEFGSKLDHISGFGERFDGISDQLNALPEIQNSLNALPTEFPKNDEELNRIHESLLLEIESLSGKIDDSSAHLSDLFSAHSFAPPTPEVEAEIEAQMEEEPKAVKKSKRGKQIQPEIEAISEELHEEVQDHLEIPEPEAQVEEPLVEFEAAIEEAIPEPELQLEEPPAEPEAMIEDVQPEAVSVEPEPETEAEVHFEEPEALVEEALLEAVEAEVEIETEVQAEELAAEFPEAVEIEPEAEAPLEEPEAEAEIQPEEPSFEAPEIEEQPVEEAPEATREEQIEETPEADPELLPEFKAKEVEYRYADPEAPVYPEFHFNNAIKQMVEERVQEMLIKDENQHAGQEAPLTFKLDELPDHLETFEDSGADAVLQTLQVEENEQYYEGSGNEEAEVVLMTLTQPKSADEDVADFDSEPEEEANSHAGHWGAMGGSGSRTWGSESSRPLELVRFEGELKPLTPIETAPIGDTIGAMVYGMGRVVYACGKNVHGFWPGREDRHVAMDFPVGTEDWRLALKGQSLFVVEDKKVKIVSIQSWYVLEQFKGEYRDQILSGSRWAGLRNDNGPVVDFRDMRGQMAAEGVRLDMEMEGLHLAGSEQRMFAGSRDGRFFEVSEFGTELLGSGPEGAELVYMGAYGEGLIAVLKVGEDLQLLHLDGEARSMSLGMQGLSGKPVVLGTKLYLADLEISSLVTVNLKKMSCSRTTCFEGVSAIRRMIGIQHKSQHDLFVITTDSGKKGGRLVMIDAKSGQETTFGTVGQASVNLIAADHHVALSTSSQYQNVIRVLEPFAERVAA